MIETPRRIEPQDIRVGELRWFWCGVDIRSVDECWRYTPRRDRDGYGLTKHAFAGTHRAHRIAYIATRGPVPEGLVLDHLCRVRDCVNPNHLEPVTNRENTMRSPISPAAVRSRQTECVHGHPFDDENTRITSRGERKCRQCDRDRMKRDAAKRNEQYRQRRAAMSAEEVERKRARQRVNAARYRARHAKVGDPR